MSDRMDDLRKEYRELETDEKMAMQAIKNQGERLLDMISGLEPCEDRELARVRIIEGIMWATRAITK